MIPLPNKQVAASGETGYQARFATTADEMASAQRLRYEVFNVELGEGLSASRDLRCDRDAFDPFYDHLVVIDGRCQSVVGTYRMQTGTMAARHLGYYSAQRFSFAPFEPVRSELMEVGRACVHRQHRSVVVVGLLWREIGRYARRHGIRYLIGCSSVMTKDPMVAAGIFRWLEEKKHLAPEVFRTQPEAGFLCPRVEGKFEPIKPPRLMRAYLALGASVCGPAAWDREFGTIVFLTILDLQSLNPAAAAHFIDRGLP